MPTFPEGVLGKCRLLDQLSVYPKLLFGNNLKWDANIQSNPCSDDDGGEEKTTRRMMLPLQSNQVGLGKEEGDYMQCYTVWEVKREEYRKWIINTTRMLKAPEVVGKWPLHMRHAIYTG